MCGELGGACAAAEWPHHPPPTNESVQALVALMWDTMREMREGKLRREDLLHPPSAAALGPQCANSSSFESSHETLPSREAAAWASAGKRLAAWSELCLDVRRREVLDCSGGHGDGSSNRSNPHFSKAFRFGDATRCNASWPRLAGNAWVLEVSHGWATDPTNIGHWGQSVFPFYAAARATPCVRALSAVVLYQVVRANLTHVRGAYTDWFHRTMQVCALSPRGGSGGSDGGGGGSGGSGGPRLLFWDDLWAAKSPVCLETALTTHATLKGPNLYVPSIARSFRRDALVLMRATAEAEAVLAGGEPARLQVLLRQHDRAWSNGEAICRWVGGRARGCGYETHVRKLQGGMPFREQLLMYAAAAVLLSAHGAQLINAAFMPRGGVVVEVFNCGDFAPGSHLSAAAFHTGRPAHAHAPPHRPPLTKQHVRLASRPLFRHVQGGHPRERPRLHRRTRPAPGLRAQPRPPYGRGQQESDRAGAAPRAARGGGASRRRASLSWSTALGRRRHCQ